MLLFLPFLCLLIKTTVQYPCVDGDDGCLVCDTSTSCSICDGGFIPFIVNGEVICRYCFMNCNLCLTNNICSSCDPPFSPTPSGNACVQCPDTNCISCSTHFDCYNCHSGFTRNLNVISRH